ncbi:MAG: alanyl-tRNA editing protein [Nitrososphaeria archaeon]|nr:alanyl-tRNA editing protein [Nitrososphaeria archaeon]
MDLSLLASLKPTIKIFYDDPYLKVCESNVIKFIREGGKGYIVLDKTIFHPQGGGQPSDIGLIVGKLGKMDVKKVMEKGNVIIHWGKVEGNFVENEIVNCKLSWPERYYNMKVHTAGHILDYALLNVWNKPVSTVSANHGPNAFIEYEGSFLKNFDKNKIIEVANTIVNEGKNVKSYYVRKEMIEKAIFNAPNLGRIPDLENYRIVEIENVNAMPCGGTHVANTKEIGEIKIDRIEEGTGTFKIFYSV